MKTTKLAIGLFLLGALLAGCSGGGSTASSPQPGPGPQPGPTPGPVVSTAQVQDQLGNTVTASFSSAIAVNDANKVIGFAETTVGAAFSAAMWSVDPTGAMTITPSRLAPIAGNAFSAAFGIDAAGNAVGQSGKGARQVAVLWKSGASAPTELEPLAATGNSAAYGVSAAGDLVAGYAQSATGDTRAVIWVADAQGSFAGRAPVALPVAAFTTSGGPSRFASATGVARVASEIWVVGLVENGSGIDRAALWRSSDGAAFTATDLGTSADAGSAALAVSSSGVIVGEVEASGGGFVPVSWTKVGADLVRSNLAAAGNALAVHSSGRAAGASGSGPFATVWNLDAGTSTVLFPDSPSQAHGMNGTLVVGRRGATGFVKRLE